MENKGKKHKIELTDAFNQVPDRVPLDKDAYKKYRVVKKIKKLF